VNECAKFVIGSDSARALTNYKTAPLFTFSDPHFRVLRQRRYSLYPWKVAPEVPAGNRRTAKSRLVSTQTVFN